MVDALDLRPRSRQLVLILADALLARSQPLLPSQELLCVACVFFVVKLEGDFTPRLRQFNSFVKNSLHIPADTLLRAEAAVLENLPPSFGLLPTFADAGAFLVEALGQRVQISTAQAALANDLAVELLLLGPPDFDCLAVSLASFFASVGPFDRREELVYFLLLITEETHNVRLTVRMRKVNALIAALTRRETPAKPSGLS